MTELNLDKYQASVLTLLFKNLPIGQSIDSIDFRLDNGKLERHYVGHARMLSGENVIHVVFTLPTNSSKVFLALTDNKMKEVSRLLANLEEFELESKLNLKLGETVITPDERESTAGLPYAVIVLPTEASIDCAAVPNSKEIEGRHTVFQVVAPLSKFEWSIRKQDGFDALIDHFESTGKDIVF